MRRKFETILLRLCCAICMGLLVLHFCCVGIFLLPPSPIRNKVIESVEAYIVPFFYQNWHLFSPNPGTHSVRINFRCRSKLGSWSNWFDAFAETELAHEANPLTGKGKLLQAYYSAAKELWPLFRLSQSEITSRLKANSRLSQIYNYFHKFSAKACSTQSQGELIDQVQIRIINSLPIQFSKRNLENQKRKFFSQEFEPRAMGSTYPSKVELQ